MITAMKKVLLLAAAAIMAVGAMQAKTADEVRIYLNAGHGSWGPNDRPMATIPYPNLAETGRPDTCGFYESNTDLWKILQMGETLEKMGVKHDNIMYSRVKNGPYPYVSGAEDAEKYNRNLTEISREVDANNMDMFVSIHSNAATDGTTTNYPLFLYRGTDGQSGEGNEGSYAMCDACWLPHYMDEIDPQSYYSRTSKNLRGDVTFYGSSSSTTTSKGTFVGYLGVLRHGTPGFLMEGFFHTYQPARHRALNTDYCHQEGIRTARGVCDYFGLTPETTGYIMGTVKDLHEKIINNLFKYSPGTNDQWMPCNGATVNLVNASGETVATYNVDQLYNGVFVFENIAPGNYKVVATCPGYKAQGDYTAGSITKEYTELVATSLGDITVEANATSYVKVYLESETYVPAEVSNPNYPDLVNTLAINLADEYNFTTLVDKSAAEALAGKTVRRSIMKDNYMYVLAIDANNAPYVYQVDPKTQTVTKEISTTGVQGSILPLSDIAFTADGYLIGCNKETTTYAGSNSFRAYKWEDLDSVPTEWFTSKLSGNFTTAVDGQTMAFTGTTKEGKLITSAVTTGSSKQIRWIIFGIESGAQTSATRNQDPTVYTAVIYGEDFSLKVSPRGENNNFIVDGSNALPLEFTLSTQDAGAPTQVGTMSADLVDVAANQPSFFKFADEDVMVYPAITDGKVTGVNLYNITEGLDKAQLIKTTATPISTGAPKKIAIDGGAACTYAGAGAVVTVDTDNDDNVLDAYITVGVLSDNVISLYTTEGATQPEVRGDYAYDLTYEEAAESYTLSFKVTRDADDASVILKPTTDGEEIVLPLGNVYAAGNDVVVLKSQLAEGVEYNWEVSVANKTIPTVSKFWTYSPAGNGTYCSRGMAIDRNTQSDYFQNMYLSNPYGTKGIYVVKPDLTVVNDGAPYFGTEFSAGNTASPFRMAVNPNDGTVYIADWSDAHSGIYTFNPANTESVGQFFTGTRQSSGAIANASGEIIGGSSTGMSFLGTGADTKMFAFEEDYPTGNAGNVVAQYNIGTENSTSVAPVKYFPTVSAKMANTNVNIVALEDGMFVSQIRGSGNNTTGVPAFVYADYEDNIIVNSGDIEDLNGNYGAGLAISDDKSMMAIATGDPKVSIYEITWSDNVPSFSLLYTVPETKAIINQMHFDHAGNLFVADAKAGNYALSIPKDAQDVVTPAKLTQILKGETTPTGVNDVNANKTVAGVMYYNVTGVASSEPFEGVNIVVTTYTDGTKTSVKVLK